MLVMKLLFDKAHRCHGRLVILNNLNLLVVVLRIIYLDQRVVRARHKQVTRLRVLMRWQVILDRLSCDLARHIYRHDFFLVCLDALDLVYMLKL